MREAALVAGLIVSFVITEAGAHRARTSFRTEAGDVQQSASGDLRLSTGRVAFEVVGQQGRRGAPGHLALVRDEWGTVFEGIELGAMVDGEAAELSIEPPRTWPQGPSHLVARAKVTAGERSFEATLTYTIVRSPPSLVLELRANDPPPNALALTAAFLPRGLLPFVRGTGLLQDWSEAKGPLVLFEGDRRSVAAGSTQGDVAFRLAPGDEGSGHALIATLAAPAAAGGRSALFFAVAPSSGLAATAGANLRHEAVRRLSGRVLGGGSGVDVWAVGPGGRLLAHSRPGPDGRFVVVGPLEELGLYATTAHTRASPIVLRAVQDDSDLELSVLPGGEARVRVTDVDTGAPLTSRLIVHGVPPTADPNFGPDYRASGAGPLIDALRGDAIVPLPTGRYRILATHGPEYTIDERMLEVAPGSTHAVELALRHAVDTPRQVACDFHVHARPSFDSPVLPEDRVLSLLSAGVDFAVPTEHNAVGDYAPALAAMGLENELASVPGVEITTFRPSLGHFGVFPFVGPDVPPYRRTNLRQLFVKARAADPTRVIQVNHPRLGPDIGYFDLVGLDPKTGRAEHDWRDDFDTLEVYNGFDGASRARVEAVMLDWLHLLELGYRFVATGDSDSHRIQYQWAGYPRTYVELPPEKADDGTGRLDPMAVVAALKAGHAFVTNGPILDADIDGHEPGDTVVVRGARAHLRFRVRAAPWIDVTEVEVLFESLSLGRFPVASRPSVVGPARGDLEGARRAAVRYTGELDVDVPEGGGFVVVIARGERKLDDVLPYEGMQPFAFTNPIWINRE